MAKMKVKCPECNWEVWLYYDNIPPKCPYCSNKDITIDEVDHEPSIYVV